MHDRSGNSHGKNQQLAPDLASTMSHQVIDSSSSSPPNSNEKIKVAIRIRPCMGHETEHENAIQVLNDTCVGKKGIRKEGLKDSMEVSSHSLVDLLMISGSIVFPSCCQNGRERENQILRQYQSRIPAPVGKIETEYRHCFVSRTTTTTAAGRNFPAFPTMGNNIHSVGGPENEDTKCAERRKSINAVLQMCPTWWISRLESQQQKAIFHTLLIFKNPTEITNLFLLQSHHHLLHHFNNSHSSSQLQQQQNQTILIQKNKMRNELQFDRVFTEDTDQQEVFEEIKGNIDSVLEGFNGTIFAYGQTGTGKTHTILGKPTQTGTDNIFPLQGNLPEGGLHNSDRTSHGIIPRSIRYILDHIHAHSKKVRFRIYCSYIEIYNEKIYDLLNYDEKNSALAIREDKHGVYVQSLTTVLVRKEQDIMQLLRTGASNRSIAQTDMNDRSSRSHTIFQLILEQEPIQQGNDPSSTGRCISKLNLVDLAGSEKWNTWRSNKSTNDNRRIQEMLNINQSLSNLGNCIAALNDNNRRHVPYRDSKLTRLLQDSLGGNCRTFFISTISPSILNYEESMSTLKFSDRANRVTLRASKNEVLDPDTLLKRYEKEIARLQRLLQENKWKQRVTQLEKENAKLKEDNARLLLSATDGADKSIATTADPSSSSSAANNSAKLKLIDQIENDQRGREQELDQYHEWLHSIPVKNSHGEYSIDMRDRLNLLEKSVEMQQSELKRAKKLFMRDTKLMRAELQEKDSALHQSRDIQASQKLMIQKLRSMLDAHMKRPSAEMSSPEELSSSANKTTQQTDSSAEQHPHTPSPHNSSYSTSSPETPTHTEKQNPLVSTISQYEEMKRTSSSQMQKSVHHFRNNLTLILQEYFVETLQSEEFSDSDHLLKDMHEEVQGLVLGCCEALLESLTRQHHNFSQSTHSILKVLHQMISNLTEKKNREVAHLHHKYRSQLKRMHRDFTTQQRSLGGKHSHSSPSLRKLSPAASTPQETTVKSFSRELPARDMLSFIKQAFSEQSGTGESQVLLRQYHSRIETIQNLERTTTVRLGTIQNSLLRLVEKVERFESKLPASNPLSFHRQQLESALHTLVEDIQHFQRSQLFMQKKSPPSTSPRVNIGPKHQMQQNQSLEAESPHSSKSGYISSSTRDDGSSASEKSCHTPKSPDIGTSEELFSECAEHMNNNIAAALAVSPHSHKKDSLKQKLLEITQSMDDLRSRFCLDAGDEGR